VGETPVIKLMGHPQGDGRI